MIAWDDQHRIQHSDGAREARVRVFADGRVIGVRSYRDPLVKRNIDKASLAALVEDLIAMAEKPVSSPTDEKQSPDDKKPLVTLAGDTALGRGMWDQEQDLVRIRHEGHTYFVHVIHPGRSDRVGQVPIGWEEMHERLWGLIDVPMPEVSEARAAIEAKLDNKVDVTAVAEPLIFMLDKLEKAHGIGVTVDLKRIHERKVSVQTKLTIECRRMPLREVLDKVLASAGLDFSVTDAGIVIPGIPMSSE